MKPEIHVKKIAPKSKMNSTLSANSSADAISDTNARMRTSSSESAHPILQSGVMAISTDINVITASRVGRRCAPVDGN